MVAEEPSSSGAEATAPNGGSSGSAAEPAAQVPSSEGSLPGGSRTVPHDEIPTVVDPDGDAQEEPDFVANYEISQAPEVPELLTSFQTQLCTKHGSLKNAWRTLTNEGASLDFVGFTRVCRKVGFKGSLKQLWDCLGNASDTNAVYYCRPHGVSVLLLREFLVQFGRPGLDHIRVLPRRPPIFVGVFKLSPASLRASGCGERKLVPNLEAAASGGQWRRFSGCVPRAFGNSRETRRRLDLLRRAHPMDGRAGAVPRAGNRASDLRVAGHSRRCAREAVSLVARAGP